MYTPRARILFSATLPCKIIVIVIVHTPVYGGNKVSYASCWGISGECVCYVSLTWLVSYATNQPTHGYTYTLNWNAMWVISSYIWGTSIWPGPSNGITDFKSTGPILDIHSICGDHDDRCRSQFRVRLHFRVPEDRRGGGSRMTKRCLFLVNTRCGGARRIWATTQHHTLTSNT